MVERMRGKLEGESDLQVLSTYEIGQLMLVIAKNGSTQYFCVDPLGCRSRTVVDRAPSIENHRSHVVSDEGPSDRVQSSLSIEIGRSCLIISNVGRESTDRI